ncbi:SAM-dependent methyltransferase [Dictyobacter alpinus]|uniref:SAM-dependent methyltransferase n=1 Tax=Dictyobacter alpinus TaxID=2014873 RepID=A0A402BGL8_9CHLR|nr:class I SAM-dependent methyltransferase [Dictyobacter alpinus]GCE30513.1 SAM-dependent methyltransferase [Dictyobacter alpinus]
MDSKQFIQQELNTQEGYATWAASYDQEDNALIALEEAFVDQLLEQVTYHKVLDVGTGTGRYALKLARKGAKVTALDQSPEMLAVAQKAAQAEQLPIDFQLGSLNNDLAYARDEFDLLISALMLCHVQDIQHAITEFARVVKVGGHLLITDFHPMSVENGWRTQFVQTGVKYLLPTMPHSVNDYLNALTNAGLTIQQLIELPVKDVPAGYMPAEIMHANADQLFCLLILAQK